MEILSKFGYTGKGYVANRNRIVGGMLVRRNVAHFQVFSKTVGVLECVRHLRGCQYLTVRLVTAVKAVKNAQRVLSLHTASALVLHHARKAYPVGASMYHISER